MFLGRKPNSKEPNILLETCNLEAVEFSLESGLLGQTATWPLQDHG